MENIFLQAAIENVPVLIQMDEDEEEGIIINYKIDRRKKHIDYANYKEYVKATKYNTRYYHQTKKEMKCPICDKPTFERFLNQHQKSMKCRLTKIEGDKPK
jgi:hypothetical protein